MKKWPEFDNDGDLPIGIHQATLTEVLQHFGTGTTQRKCVGQQLERIFILVTSTEKVARFVIYGSFVTAKRVPGDVDIFLVMEDSFDVDQVHGETALIFDHQRTHDVFGASVFWVPEQAFTDEMWAFCETKRDKTRRGIVEVIHNDSE